MKQTISPKEALRARIYQEGWELSQREYQTQWGEKKKSTISSLSKKAKYLFILLLLLSCGTQAFSQKLTQTIRGKVIDQESLSPLVGATVMLVGSNPLLGSSTDVNGTFEIKDVPIGRHTLKISSIGYEEAVIPELVVGSGKEIVLTIRLQEAFTQLNEVVVTAEQEKAKPLNEMATVSARSFTVEETQRYAASVNDPARMVASFPGVASNDDGTNEIVVRGNSPRGVQWRVEGIEIPNPNHFGTEGATGGGITMMSANMLDASDFYTGAFPAEYGNAYSGIFDINLRNGNNQKREYAAQIGLLGADFAAEGPFSKSYNGSYLINYRYSTLAMLDKLGVSAIDNAIPIFQDLSFKMHLPTQKRGVFNLWGIGGLSNQAFNDEKESDDFRYNMGVGGLSHRVLLTDRTYLESIISVAKSVNAYEGTEVKEDWRYTDRFEKSTLRGSWMLNHKLNSMNTVRAGFIASHEVYDLLQKYSTIDTSAVQVNSDGNTQLYQAYGQWKARLAENFTLNAGLHGMLLGLNNNYSIEPRFGFQWTLSPAQSLNFGFGVHSKMEPLIVYYSRYKDGAIPNKNLEFMKAYHYVLGYNYAIRPDLLLKTELYYQQLTKVPIAPVGTDDQEWLGYSSINYKGGEVNHPLVNEGTGRNYGMELSLEKFFTNSYYFTLTGSLYESKYTGRDGIERNSRFNGNFTANLLLGKEFYVDQSKNNILGINIRTLTSGGNRWTPVLLAASREKGEAVYDWNKRFTEREGMYFRTDLRISYRRNKPKHASIWSLDFQNVTNHQNVWVKYYDEEEEEIKTAYQVGLIPILSYRIEF